MLRILGLSLSVLFLLFCGTDSRYQTFVDWNLTNAPFVGCVYLYPFLKKGYRWVRFILFA